MRYVFIFLVFCSIPGALAQETARLSKKETKFAEAMFPEHAIAEELEVVVQDTTGWGDLRSGDRVWMVKQQDQLYGYLLSTSAMGRFEYFDYLLAYNTGLSVLGLTVTTYRSSHGAAICQKKWLSQFEGYSGEELQVGKDIDSVSGATISAESLVRDLKRCHALMLRLREQDYIQGP